MAEHCDLILYVEPGGELGARCAEFWAAVSAAGASTDAQSYPPHVTLTGFFHRPTDRIPDVVAAATAALDVTVPPGLDGVRWASPAALDLRVDDSWTGLHVVAPWMDAVVAAFTAPESAAQPVRPDEDALRPKSWLHVSLAYGEGYDAHARAAATEHAAAFAGLASETEWALSVWRRDGSRWERLSAIAVTG